MNLRRKVREPMPWCPSGHVADPGHKGGKVVSEDECEGTTAEGLGKKRRNHTRRQQMLNKQAQQRFRCAAEPQALAFAERHALVQGF